MNMGRPSYLMAVSLTFIAVVVRLSIVDTGRPLGGDEVEYHALAVRLAEGRGFTREDGTPTAYYAPGLPFLLSILYRWTGPDPTSARVMLATFGGLSSGLVFLLGAHFWGPWVGVVAGMLWTFCLYNLKMNGSLLGEPLATVLLLTALLGLLYRPIGLNFLAGVSLGLAVLVRPYLILTAIPIAYYTWAKRKKVPVVLAFLIGFGLVVGGWMVRNAMTMGSLTLSTQVGVELLSGNHRLARGSWLPPAVFV